MFCPQIAAYSGVFDWTRFGGGRTMPPVAQLTPRRRGRAGRRSAVKPPPQPREPLWVNRGRAWINGSEVGGTDPRYAHLNRSYD
jgi:hypothetical protein